MSHGLLVDCLESLLRDGTRASSPDPLPLSEPDPEPAVRDWGLGRFGVLSDVEEALGRRRDLRATSARAPSASPHLHAGIRCDSTRCLSVDPPTRWVAWGGGSRPIELAGLQLSQVLGHA